MITQQKVRAEWVNPFLSPAKLVWNAELGCDLELIGAELVSRQFTTEDLTAVIGVSGKLEGNVLYGFSGGTAVAVVSRMMGEEVTTVSDEIGLLALGEIANMITGTAATRLSQIGYPCDISPPVIIEPSGSRFTTVGGPQIRVSFSSSLGFFTVRIVLFEKAAKD